MPKYSISDGHQWADEKKQSNDRSEPRASLGTHRIEVLDHRQPDDQNMQYEFFFEQGEAVGIYRNHQLAGSNQYDPMGAVAPKDVPVHCRQLVADEFGTDRWQDVVNIERCTEFAEWQN